jgi:hypothetical protein
LGPDALSCGPAIVQIFKASPSLDVEESATIAMTIPFFFPQFYIKFGEENEELGPVFL